MHEMQFAVELLRLMLIDDSMVFIRSLTLNQLQLHEIQYMWVDISERFQSNQPKMKLKVIKIAKFIFNPDIHQNTRVDTTKPVGDTFDENFKPIFIEICWSNCWLLLWKYSNLPKSTLNKEPGKKLSPE